MKKGNLVKKGYDEIGSNYMEYRDLFSNLPELEIVLKHLPEKGNVLDAGCGTGLPIAKFFVEKGFSVTGIDISETMIELAKVNVPEAKFFRSDMSKLDFPELSFDCITAIYSMFHVPKEKHSSVLENFYRMLKPAGILFFCLGTHSGDSYGDDFIGVEMFWSNYSPEKSLSLVKETGFLVLFDEILEKGDELHYWIIAQK